MPLVNGRRRSTVRPMDVMVQVLLFVGMCTAAMVLLVVLQLLLRVPEVDRPQDDPSVQLHEATARALIRVGGFGP